MNNKKLIAIGVSVVAAISIFFIVLFCNNNKATFSGKLFSKKISNINYYKLSNIINSDKFKNLTDAQKDTYINKYINKRIQWSGYVEDVDSFGNVEIDMQSPKDYFSDTDIKFKIPKEKVLGLNKDQKITFQGDITYINKEPFGHADVCLKDVEIVK